MVIQFNGYLDEVKEGIDLLKNRLCYEIGTGIDITVEKIANGLEVTICNGIIKIGYSRKIEFFRALGLAIEHIEKKKILNLKQIPAFSSCGIMADCSRNAVMTVESIKTMLEMMAIMGLDTLMIYTEDVYKIDELPYFGYMRGSYGKEELIEVGRFAKIFGIEMVPCIQTLAHLKQALKWNYATDMIDTPDILLVGEEKTYEFIDKMVGWWQGVFESKRIHIGMDEAFSLGLGKYLNKNGYTKRFDIMTTHVKKVLEITSKYGFEPMLWSDMYFRLQSKNGSYYDEAVVITPEISSTVPEDISLVYWDYYHDKTAEYGKMLVKHHQIGRNTIFAGGIWTWNGMCVNYGKTFATSRAGLEACKNNNIKEVVATLWGDNGAETNIFTSALGWQLYAEFNYCDKPDDKHIAERFKFCAGADFKAFYDISAFDDIHGNGNIITENPSKCIFYQNIMAGLFDANIKGLEFNNHYEKLSKTMAEHAKNNDNWSDILNFYSQFAVVLALKCDIGIKIKEAYDNDDKTTLSNLLKNELCKLRENTVILGKLYRKQWHKYFKPQGFEIVDSRIGGVLQNIDTASFRIEGYINGEFYSLSELDDIRLPFNDHVYTPEQGLIRCNSHDRISSAGVSQF